jgi:hypothetical protein
MRAVTFTSVALCLLSIAAHGAERPSYKLDAGKTRVVALSHLADGQDCQPARLAGKVVKRKFDDFVGTIVTGVTVEERDGARTFANVTVGDHPNWALDVGRVNAEWIAEGLQTLLQEGNRVSLGIFLCGASGSVLLVDSVRRER